MLYFNYFHIRRYKTKFGSKTSANTYCDFSKAAHIKRLVKILTIVIIQASIVLVWDPFAQNRSLCIDIHMSDVIL